MKRRSRAGVEPIKGQRRKTPEPKSRNAPEVQASSKLFPTTEDTEVARLTRELSEERKQRTATSEVLHLLSGSNGDLNRLFDTILTNATKLCQANFGSLFLCEADAFRIVAQHNAPRAFAELRRREPLVRGRPLLRVAETKQVVQIADVREHVASNQADKDAVTFAKVSGVRTLLMVPMLKDGEVVGAIVIYRQEVRTFNDREIELLRSFAAQAVIAIENARLLNELRGALERQIATSQVLQVISSSPGDLEPVFATMLENAIRICDAKFGNIYRAEGDGLRNVATHNTPTAFAEALRSSPYLSPGPRNPVRRMINTKTIVHVVDVRATEAYAEREPIAVASVELGGTRTLMIVPMLKDNELVGAFTLARQEVRPFIDKQIELVKNFAAQAVIAIENARLLNELRQSLEQQTATSEVLQVISSSPGDLRPVFATMLEKAVRICDAKFGTLYLHEEGGFRLVAGHEVPEFIEARGSSPIQPAPGGGLDTAMRTKRTAHLPDLAATQSYAERHPRMVEAVELSGMRTVVAVPMLKDNDLVGVIAVFRREVRPFSDKQVALVENFASQAVIAIDNARLLNELRQSLEQQTATADVLQVISRSPGDLEPVFATMLEQAVRICAASFGSMVLREGDMFRRVAIHDAPPEFVDFHKSRPTLRLSDAFALDQILRTKQVVQIGDAQAEEPDSPIAKYGGARTLLTVPLLKENEVIGALGVYRQEVRLFSDKQIALVENFAAQAVIAIENARLLNELRQRTTDLTERTADLTEALEQQTATSEVLQVIVAPPAIFSLYLPPCLRKPFGFATPPLGTSTGGMVSNRTSSRPIIRRLPWSRRASVWGYALFLKTL